MSQYKRSTRMCSFEDLRPNLRQSLRAYLREHELSHLETEISLCCETLSEREKTSALETLLKEDPDQRYSLAAFITPEWLVWARSGDQANVIVAGARLKDIHVRTHASVMSKDTGIHIEGFVDGAFSKMRGYLALGAEPAAQEFVEVVEKAVKAANPPRRLIDLFGKIPR